MSSEREQELRVRLKAVNEELEQLQEYKNTLLKTQSELTIALNSEVYGVSVGDIVTIDRNDGKLKANSDLLVVKVDDTFWEHCKPWVYVRYKTKSGAWSKDTVCLYRNWRLKGE